MTKEEIRQKAVDNADKRIKEVDKKSLSAIADYDRGLIQGFEDCAEWMQEKMQETNEVQALLYAVEKTAERTKREMIEKAAEWLYIYYPTLEKSKSFEDAWKHFKQAMEDESK